MPLGADFFGTNSNGTLNEEYCKFCFQDGRFTKPTITVQEMIESSVAHMQRELGLPEEEARRLANARIPHLHRWNKTT